MKLVRGVTLLGESSAGRKLRNHPLVKNRLGGPSRESREFLEGALWLSLAFSGLLGLRLGL